MRWGGGWVGSVMASMGSNVELHRIVRERLSEREQRYTTGRRRILDALVAAGGPVTLPELLADQPSLAQSSAYRNLSIMEEAGIVRRLVHGSRARTLRAGGGPDRAPPPSHLRELRADPRHHPQRPPRALARLGVRRCGPRRGLLAAPPRDRHLRQVRRLRRLNSRVDLLVVAGTSTTWRGLSSGGRLGRWTIFCKRRVAWLGEYASSVDDRRVAPDACGVGGPGRLRRTAP